MSDSPESTDVVCQRAWPRRLDACKFYEDRRGGSARCCMPIVAAGTALFCSRSSCQHATSATIVQRYRITMLLKYSFSRARHKCIKAATRQTQYLGIIRKQLACVLGATSGFRLSFGVAASFGRFHRSEEMPMRQMLLFGHETTIVAKNVGCLIVVHVKALKSG